jgi:hypothetical protein
MPFIALNDFTLFSSKFGNFKNKAGLNGRGFSVVAGASDGTLNIWQAH